MLILSLLGVIISGYQAYEHYFLESSFCDFSENFSCSAVTGSNYGDFPIGSGIALSIYGLLWFGLLAFVLYKSLRGKDLIKKDQEFYIFAYLSFGILFVIYLLIVELYLLPLELGEVVICPLCTILHVSIATLFLMSYNQLKKPMSTYFEEIFME